MQQKTILLIEDHSDSRDVYGTALRHSGYRVLEAEDGREGVRLARQHRPDAIVMDMGLPLMDGWQATQELKADPSMAPIPVIAVTVHAQDSYRARSHAAGCDAFLEKPCSPTRLLGEISRFLDRQ